MTEVEGLAELESLSVALRTRATRSATAGDGLTEKGHWLLTPQSLWVAVRNRDWRVNTQKQIRVWSRGCDPGRLLEISRHEHTFVLTVISLLPVPLRQLARVGEHIG